MVEIWDSVIGEQNMHVIWVKPAWAFVIKGVFFLFWLMMSLILISKVGDFRRQWAKYKVCDDMDAIWCMLLL